MMFKKTTLAILVNAAFLAGCAGWQQMDTAIKNDRSQADRITETARANLQRRLENAPPKLLVEKKGVFLGGRSISLKTDSDLPARFANVTINHPGVYTLPQAAQIITRYTGLPVVITPDAQEALNKSTAPPPNTTMLGGDPASQRAMQQLAVGAALARTYPVTFNLKEDRLGVILDSIAAAVGLNWEYRDGTINFYRFQTKTLTVIAPTQKIDTTLAIGITGNQNTGISTGNTGASNATGSQTGSFTTTLTTSIDPWADIEKMLNAIKSENGKVIINKAASSVIITDGKRQVAEAQKAIEDSNAIYRRQVHVKVEIISFTSSSASNFGINWTAVARKLDQLGNATQQASFSSPAFTNISNAGGGAVSIIRQVNGNVDLSNSELLLQALAEQGEAVISNTFGAICANRTETPIARVSTDGFIAATTPAAAVAGTTSAVPGLTPGSVTYGLMLRMFPNIEADGRMRLEFGMNLSDLISLKDKSSGTGASQQTITVASLLANQLNQAPTLRTGDTVLVTDLENRNSKSDKQTLTEDGNPGLGGSFSGKRSRQILLMLITPSAIGEN